MTQHRDRSGGTPRSGAAPVVWPATIHCSRVQGDLLPRDLIHVAGLNLRWTATLESVRESVCSAVEAAWEAGYASIALPLIGAGTGALRAADVEEEIAAVLDVYAASPGERGRVLQVTLVTPGIGRAA